MGEPRTFPLLFSATNETLPEGVPLEDVTLTFAENALVAEDPPVVLTTVVVVAVRTAEFHLFSKLLTLMEPMPVARSYFVVDWNAGVPLSAAAHSCHAGVVELLAPQIRTPKPSVEVLLLLQFGVPDSHATELLPLLMSLKTHAALGTCGEPEELVTQFPPM